MTAIVHPPTDISDLFTRHQVLYETIARSHPSLLGGIVRCSRCGRSRTVEPAKCLRDGWPRCCSVTMGLRAAEVAP